MKSVVSSFSMTIAQAQALQEATRSEKNRSAWINRAIEAKIRGADAFNLADINTRQIMMALHARICPDCESTVTCPTYITLSNLVGFGR
jgi:hypothetical protein